MTSLCNIIPSAQLLPGLAVEEQTMFVFTAKYREGRASRVDGVALALLDGSNQSFYNGYMTEQDDLIQAATALRDEDYRNAR